MNGKTFLAADPDIIIQSDASLSGWGACSNGATARGPWTSTDCERHINELELIGAFNAIRCFANRSEKVFIRIFLDNNTAVCYLNKQGGTRSKSLTPIAKRIADWCEVRGNIVQAVYLPGKLNIVANRESRSSLDSSDWKLDPDIFRRIASLWPVKIDFFSNEWNAQLPEYVAWKPQPGAWGLDAFQLIGRIKRDISFPPFH